VKFYKLLSGEKRIAKFLNPKTDMFKIDMFKYNRMLEEISISNLKTENT
jgi:hypothetical protein